MSFPPCEIIKDFLKVLFQYCKYRLIILHLEALNKTFLYKPKNPFPGSFRFSLLLSIIPLVPGCYSRINTNQILKFLSQ